MKFNEQYCENYSKEQNELFLIKIWYKWQMFGKNKEKTQHVTHSQWYLRQEIVTANRVSQFQTAPSR